MKQLTSTIGTLPDGTELKEFTFKRSDGASLSFLNYGGIITEINLPDRNNKIDNIVIGFRDRTNYLEDHPCLGALVGRFANRIANGSFCLNGNKVQLPVNNGTNHLHGGNKGFDRVIWDVRWNEDKAVLNYRSPDGHQGYPGKLSVEIEYQFTEDLQWQLRYRASTDKPTIVNFTNHTYFNLGGVHQNDILDHVISIQADEYLPVDENFIPIKESPVWYRGLLLIYAIQRKLQKSLDYVTRKFNEQVVSIIIGPSLKCP